jgi:hypothetical protein
VFENVAAKCAVIIFIRGQDGTIPGFFGMRINEIFVCNLKISLLQRAYFKSSYINARVGDD